MNKTSDYQKFKFEKFEKDPSLHLIRSKYDKYKADIFLDLNSTLPKSGAEMLVNKFEKGRRVQKWKIVPEKVIEPETEDPVITAVPPQGPEVAAAPKYKTANVILPFFDRAQEIKYNEVDGMAVLQGDIILGTASEIVTPDPGLQKRRPDFYEEFGRRGGVPEIGSSIQAIVSTANGNRLWDRGIIPYKISSDFTSRERSMIEDGIRELNNRTNLTIIPHTGQFHHVLFVRKEGINASGSSRLGRTRLWQRIKLNPEFFDEQTVIHELLHAAGFYHEQCRHDRDRFVEILWDNIDPDAAHNFERLTEAESNTWGRYDKQSIMHYGGRAYAKSPGLVTIRDKSTGRAVSSSRSLSAEDIDGINSVYDFDAHFLISRPTTTLRHLTLTMTSVSSGDEESGLLGKPFDYYPKGEIGEGWHWHPGASHNSTEHHSLMNDIQSGRTITPNWQFHQKIPVDATEIKIYLTLMDDDGLASNDNRDDVLDINPINGLSSVPILVKSSGEIYLGGYDHRIGTPEESILGYMGDEIVLEGYEGDRRAAITFKVEFKE